MVKTFEKNSRGKIEFTEKELEQLLNEVYREAATGTKSTIFTWVSPTDSYINYVDKDFYIDSGSVINRPITYVSTTGISDITGTLINNASNNTITATL